MANEDYAFGMDWYEENTVKSWPSLVAWDKNIEFAYFRLGIGAHADNLALLNECRARTPWALGGYYEIYLRFVAKDRQLNVVLGQLEKCKGILSLPVSLAFEPMTYRDAKGNKITEWPSAGDLKYVATGLANRGYRVNIYTNESGLKILKASNLFDWANVDWWYSSTLAFPLWNTERGVDGVLSYIQSKYGIQREHVQFMQTVIDHGDSPIGGGQDFDRAVSWNFQPVPEPEPQPIEVRVPKVVSVNALIRDNGVHVGGVMKDSTLWGVVAGDRFDLRGSVSMSVLANPATEPAPQPEPIPEGEFYQVLHDQQSEDCNFKPRQASPRDNGSYDFHGKPETVRFQVDGAEAVLMTRGIQVFMAEALKRKAPASVSVGDAYRSLYRTDRAFNNGCGYGDKPYADFVNGRDEDASLPKLSPPVITAGKVVKRLDDKTYTIMGEAHYKVETLRAGSLPDIAVDNIDTMPWHWIPATVGTVVSVTTGEEDHEFTNGPWRVDPFPQLGGNDVPVPHITNAGYCYIAVSRLKRVDNPLDCSPYVPER